MPTDESLSSNFRPSAKKLRTRRHQEPGTVKMNTFLNIANAYLVTFGLLFNHFRIHDLAIVNTCALVFLNGNSANKSTYVYGLFANGFTTAALGYPYFLTEDMNHGVYMILLGSALMMYSAYANYYEFITQYQRDYTAQNEYQEIDEEDEDEKVTQGQPIHEESDTETEEETEDDDDFSELPPLIPVRRTDSISDYPAMSKLRVEIPPVDVAALLAAEETKKED